MKDFEPKIVVFCCNWCSYAGADLAGTSRLKIKPNFRVIRTMCSGRVEPSLFSRSSEGASASGGGSPCSSCTSSTCSSCPLG